jgi:phage/plasmid-like protein (TIGR03299 family)
MAHNINVNPTTQKHAFFSRTAAWHKLGQTVTEAQTWEQAITLAGLDWEVEKVQLTHPTSGDLIPAWGTFRSDNHAFLGTVGNVYEPIQNRYQFDFVDALLEMENGAHYETAGALGNGERVFCLAKIGGGFDVHGIGDRHETYLLFTTSHDGRSSAKVLLTAVRVVCQNTLQMALSAAGKNALTIRHTKSAAEKLVEARKLIGAEQATKENLKKKLEALAERKLRKNVIADVMRRVFAFDEKGLPTAQSATAINEVMDRFEDNDNDTFPEIRGTAYNLLNAFTEYTDHFKPVRVTEGRKGLDETALRADNAMFGSGAQFKGSVLDAILDATKHSQTRAIYRPTVAVGGKVTSVLELETLPAKSILDEILEQSLPIAP